MRMVRTLRAELGAERGTVHCFAARLGYGTATLVKVPRRKLSVIASDIFGASDRATLTEDRVTEAPHAPRHTVGYCDGRPDINPSADRSPGA